MGSMGPGLAGLASIDQYSVKQSNLAELRVLPQKLSNTGNDLTDLLDLPDWTREMTDLTDLTD